MASNAHKAPRNMNQAHLSILIDYYVGDMQRRGCTIDSVLSNKRALKRLGRHLAPGDGAIPLSGITLERLNDYVRAMQERDHRWPDHPTLPPTQGSLSPFTIRKEVKILRGFGAWLAREGLANPFSGLPVPKVPKRIVETLSDEEIEKLLAAINPNTPDGGRRYALIVFMLHTGLRVSEVAGARLSDLDLARRQLKVMGKGRKERMVMFGQQCAQALLRYLNLHRATPAKPENDQLFLSMDGMPLNRNSLELVFRRLRRASGVPRLHPHLLRHTFAVRFLLNGGDPFSLQALLGHETMEVTRMYVHLTRTQIAEKYQADWPLDSLPIVTPRRFGNRRAPAKKI